MATLQLHSLVVFAILLTSARAQSVERTTAHGKVRGYLHEPLPDRQVERYFGIPYAAPPVGQLRLEPPQPPSPWSHVLNATTLPPACKQEGPRYIQEHMPDFKGPYQEDCLYLNLYVPSRAAREQNPLPVLVHVHGGSNVAGMGAMLHGDALALTGEIIVVNFNYRLHLLGFLGLGEEGFRGNFGLLDQVAALRWVKDNIAYFGGDPDHVTVEGHSAGGADVGLHLVSPLSRGLFRRAVLQSGFPFGYYAVEEAPFSTRNATLRIAEDFMCQGDAESIKSCLKRLPAAMFFTLKRSFEVGHTTSIAFVPAIVDRHFIHGRAEELFSKAANINGEAFMMGVTGDDGLFEPVDGNSTFRLATHLYDSLPPTDAVRHVPNVATIVLHEYTPHEQPALRDNDTENMLAYGRLVGDSIFRAPGARTANSLSKASKPVFFYSFDYDSPLSPGVGVPHGLDLFYLFGCPFTGHPNYVYSQEERDVSSELMTLWANFVRHGVPRTRQGTALSPYTATSLAYFSVTAENGSATVRQDRALRAHQVALWNELLPKLAEAEASSSQNTMRVALIATVTILGTIIAVLLVLLIVFARRHWRMRGKHYSTCAQNASEV